MTTRQRLIKRLTWYYPTEALNALVALGGMVYVLWQYGLGHSIFLLYGLLIVDVILWQGTYYWWLKLRRMQAKPVNQALALSRFHTLQRLNIWLIAGIPIAFIGQWLLMGRQFLPVNHLGWALAANGFAILEHINYYHWQLTYDNKFDWQYLARNRRLKTASLRKDLNENRL